MPLFKVQDKLYYYAHVPKCAGSSVKVYLYERFGEIGFNDPHYMARREPHRWTKTSAQHVTYKDLTRLIPADWIAGSFTVVRNPLSRLISAYQFQRDVERMIDPSLTIENWFARWIESKDETPFQYDNHLVPQTLFVPPGAKVFYLEHGVNAIIPWLDAIEGGANDMRIVDSINTAKAKGEKPVPSQELRDMVSEVYAEDFERFQYRIDQKMPLADAPEQGAPTHGDIRNMKMRKLKYKVKRRLGLAKDV
ncbi:sulfotransferase family 2 domain-containing protein [Paracoccaceae bacterium GXU_MW_L88]